MVVTLLQKGERIAVAARELRELRPAQLAQQLDRRAVRDALGDQALLVGEGTATATRTGWTLTSLRTAAACTLAGIRAVTAARPSTRFFGADSPANLRSAIDYCLAHPKWRLSVQTHKLLGLP